MPAFFDIGRADEQETESRQPPEDGVLTTIVSAKNDGRGWRLTGPFVALWRALRGKKTD